MAISRMQQPRQMYGLGSLVKKAVRGVKKIVKSPIGKAALLYAVTMGLGSLGSGLTGMARFAPSNFMGNMGRIGGFLTGKGGAAKTGLGKWWGGLSGGQKLFAGAGLAATALPFLMKGDEEEDVVEESWTNVPSSIADIRNQARDYYRNPASSTLAFMPNKQFVDKNWYAADGGRAGLLNGGEAGQEQIEQMLMAEYVKYKNQGGTLSFEEFVQAVMQAQQEQQGGGMEQPQEVAMAANGGRIGYKWGGLGNLMSTIKTGAQRAGGKIKSLFDDADISIQIRDEDVMTDWGPQAQAVGQDVFVTVKSGKSKKVLEDLITEGYDISKASDDSYLINSLDEGALDIIAQKLKLGGGDIKDFMKNYDDVYSGTDDQMIFEALKNRKADGGRIGAYAGGPMSEDEDEYNYDPQAAMKMYKRQGKQEGGIMETEEASEMIDMDGMEKDYRETGGFVEIGGKERADDVPARLSKNEFVFTADAVRAAGGGDIDKGSEVMQNLMDNLEAGGEVSEDSQGLEGAQAMYDQQQMLQSRIA